jgi:hypothetical protein
MASLLHSVSIRSRRRATTHITPLALPFHPIGQALSPPSPLRRRRTGVGDFELSEPLCRSHCFVDRSGLIAAIRSAKTPHQGQCLCFVNRKATLADLRWRISRASASGFVLPGLAVFPFSAALASYCKLARPYRHHPGCGGVAWGAVASFCKRPRLPRAKRNGFELSNPLTRADWLRFVKPLAPSTSAAIGFDLQISWLPRRPSAKLASFCKPAGPGYHRHQRPRFANSPAAPPLRHNGFVL